MSVSCKSLEVAAAINYHMENLPCSGYWSFDFDGIRKMSVLKVLLGEDLMFIRLQ